MPQIEVGADSVNSYSVSLLSLVHCISLRDTIREFTPIQYESKSLDLSNAQTLAASFLQK